MAIKKSLIVTGAIASIGLASLGAIGTVAADTNSDNLAQKIAQKFNLNQDEVQNVLDEHRDEVEAEHKENIDDRLTKAVSDGKITEEQKTKILAKAEELKQDREANKDKVKNMTEDERKAFMEERRDTLDKWADENDIPGDAMHFVMPHHGHGGPGRQ